MFSQLHFNACRVMLVSFRVSPDREKRILCESIVFEGMLSSIHTDERNYIL